MRSPHFLSPLRLAAGVAGANERGSQLTESVVEALEQALVVADHLVSPKYAPTIAAAKHLARRLDTLAARDSWVDDSGKLDNVTVPTFLRYMEALGLTVPKPVAGTRGKAQPAPESAPEAEAEPDGPGATISRLVDRQAQRQAR